MSFPFIIHPDRSAGMQALVVFEPLNSDVIMGQVHSEHSSFPLFGCYILEWGEEFESDSYQEKKNSLIPALKEEL